MSTMRRLATLVATAVVPLAVLGVFFVLPVSRHGQQGVRRKTASSTSAVSLDVLTRPEIQRAVWFTLWTSTAGDAARLRARPAGGVRPPSGRDPRPHLDPRGPGRPLRAPDRRRRRRLRAGDRRRRAARRSWASTAPRSRSSPAWSSSTHRSSSASSAAPGSRSTHGPQRPPPRSARRRGRCSATSPCPPSDPAIVSAATVVFLFCATAFGIVLTLGGLRYSSVETQIYLLTTNLLDLQAAAALSVLQLLVVTGPPGRGRPRAAYAGPHGRPVPGPATATACWRPPRPRRDGRAPRPGGRADRVARGRRPSASTAPGAWPTTAPSRRPGSHQALLVPVTDALVNSLRIAVDATWMSLLLGPLGRD